MWKFIALVSGLGEWGNMQRPGNQKAAGVGGTWQPCEPRDRRIGLEAFVVHVYTPATSVNSGVLLCRCCHFLNLTIILNRINVCDTYLTLNANFYTCACLHGCEHWSVALYLYCFIHKKFIECKIFLNSVVITQLSLKLHLDHLTNRNSILFICYETHGETPASVEGINCCRSCTQLSVGSCVQTLVGQDMTRYWMWLSARLRAQHLCKISDTKHNLLQMIITCTWCIIIGHVDYSIND